MTDYLLDQLDGAGGYEHFLYVSDALIAKNERDRLLAMWRGLIRMRKRLKKSEALMAMQHFADVLLKAGDEAGSFKVKQEIQTYSSDMKIEYPTIDKRKIDEVLFWEIFERVKAESESAVSRPDVLFNILLNFKASEIKCFDQIFQDKLQESYTWDLWGVAYIAFGGCGDDGFDYFRAWLISEGNVVFRAAIAKAESLVDMELKPTKLDALLYVAGEVFELKSGKPLTARRRKRTKPSGVEWAEDDAALKERFPKAWAISIAIS